MLSFQLGREQRSGGGAATKKLELPAQAGYPQDSQGTPTLLLFPLSGCARGGEQDEQREPRGEDRRGEETKISNFESHQPR